MDHLARSAMDGRMPVIGGLAMTGSPQLARLRWENRELDRGRGLPRRPRSWLTKQSVANRSDRELVQANPAVHPVRLMCLLSRA